MSSMIVWAAVLGAAGLTLLWWDLVDFVLDRVGPAAAPWAARSVSEGRRSPARRWHVAAGVTAARPAVEEVQQPIPVATDRVLVDQVASRRSELDPTVTVPLGLVRGQLVPVRIGELDAIVGVARKQVRGERVVGAQRLHANPVLAVRDDQVRGEQVLGRWLGHPLDQDAVRHVVLHQVLLNDGGRSAVQLDTLEVAREAI